VFINLAVPVTEPTSEECSAVVYGDEIVADPDVVLNWGFYLPAMSEEVWPWLVQLGKHRAGWYLPLELEQLLPNDRAGLRHLSERLQHLTLGEVVADWGGRNATRQVIRMVPPRVLAYRSQRRHTVMSWTITLTQVATPGDSRVHLRVRLGPVRHTRLVGVLGGFLGKLAIGLLAAGLLERVVAENLHEGDVQPAE
jgi:hypothetical protein